MNAWSGEDRDAMGPTVTSELLKVMELSIGLRSKCQDTPALFKSPKILRVNHQSYKMMI